MAALTADFDSYILNQRALNKATVDAGDVVYIGSVVTLDSTGSYVQAAASGTSYKVIGQAMKGTDGTETADTSIPVREGDVFLNLAEDGADKPVASDIGSIVYMASDNEITMRSSTNPKAGILLALENGGALVRLTQEATV